MDTPYLRRFTDIHEILEKRKIGITSQFKIEIQDAEDAIGFQFWLSEEIHKLLSNKMSKLPLRFPEQLVLIFMWRNIHYLLSCLSQCTQGLVSTCCNNIRIIYETILMMYYVWEYPEDADLLFAYYVNGLNSKQKKKIESKKWFTHSFLVDRLYSERTKNSLRGVYKVVCQKAHPNITGALLDTDLLPSKSLLESIHDCLDLILTFSFFNIAATVEVFFDILEPTHKKHIKDKLLDLLAAINAGTQGIPILEPDYPSILKEPRIRRGNIRL
jgi:hypothetical protein